MGIRKHHTLTVINESEECLLDQELSVEHNQLRRGRYQVVALVELEELDEYLGLIFLCKNHHRNTLLFTSEHTACANADTITK